MSSPYRATGGRRARRWAALLVRLRWWVIGFWAVVALASPFLPTLGESQGVGNLSGLLPKDTPAVTTELRSVDLFGFPLTGRTAVVQRDPHGLSVFDQARTVVNAVAVEKHQRPGLRRLRGALPLTNGLGAFPGSREEGTTALTYLLFDPTVSFSAQTRAARRYAAVSFGPRDSFVGVTGSVPARAAQGHIIHDSLPLVEALTLGAILLIVGAAFRSVVAPLLAAVTTGVAYLLTVHLSGELAQILGFATPSELEPVIVALLLGVVTDYVVFYLTALREQLESTADRLEAARSATARCTPIVAVAGLAVAAGTGALLVAQSLFFRALGPALVFTVLLGLLVAVTLVPAMLSVLGGWAFWPVRPRARRPAPRPETLRMRVLAALTHSRRAAGLTVAGCVAVLLVAALPLLRMDLGVSFVGSLPPDNGVRQAADAARAGFAPGILSPTTVLLEGKRLDRQRGRLRRLGQSLEQQPGVAGVLYPGSLPRRLERGVLTTRDGRAARLLVVLDHPALGATAINTVDHLDSRLPALLRDSGLSTATAGLAGDTATAAYIVDQTSGDLLRIALAALAANLLMLIIFLRAVVAAAYLLLGSLLSLGAALGLTTLVFGHLDPGAGLTFYVPFAGAVLLLAFGSDYNIFAVGNVWEVARTRPLSEAVALVMPGTITAILVAGLALAASFGLLAVVPLVPFRQLALVMLVGILLDVLVVRSLLLPAMLTVVGPASAWPSRLGGSPPADPAPGPAVGPETTSAAGR
ncbi:MMPL family transporter [Nocardioides panaciterrulae]|uniref:RND superfamily putative drug exporter n=1 Tax=Nocardioides panaciterrulae TaxID=661492 RepID=A0A7Y9E3T2_9ACTN|nr:MMPL family transporter [Nocardioides panaciterrulae]NYD40381.1 RND superfamily putative drug exporter [Nocardioides panaciterrulae]